MRATRPISTARNAHGRGTPTLAGAVMLLLLCASCSDVPSALSTAGRDADTIAQLFRWMVAGAAIVWTIVIGLATYAIVKPRQRVDRATGMLIIGGGVVVPTIVLAGLLTYALSLMPRLLAPGPSGSVIVEVVGEQWWWRVRYRRPDGAVIEAANEVRLPVNRRTTLRLSSADVIHSFWVPALGGKMDMIPGRLTTLGLEPVRTGRYDGVCAEFCGTSHGLMRLTAVVMEPAAFEQWLDAQAGPAVAVEGALPVAGREVFTASGCGACHAVRGTTADGLVGPDLTHVGGRVTLAAGLLPNEAGAFARWVRAADALKPDAHMPGFEALDDGELRALAAYLDALR